MFVRTPTDLEAAGRVLTLATGTRSSRVVVAGDGIGFSYNDNYIGPSDGTDLWYRNHWEGNFIISGHCEVTDLTTGEKYAFGPGDLVCRRSERPAPPAGFGAAASCQHLLPSAPG
jgi:L-ectoine synthase